MVSERRMLKVLRLREGGAGVAVESLVATEGLLFPLQSTASQARATASLARAERRALIWAGGDTRELFMIGPHLKDVKFGAGRAWRTV